MQTVNAVHSSCEFRSIYLSFLQVALHEPEIKVSTNIFLSKPVFNFYIWLCEPEHLQLNKNYQRAGKDIQNCSHSTQGILQIDKIGLEIQRKFA